MKKIIIAAIAAFAAAALTACGSSSAVNQNTVEPSVKKKASYEMTSEKAAGKYELTAMDEFGSGDIKTSIDSYSENTLTLAADGTFAFAAQSGENRTEYSGTYEISADGTVKFSDDFHIAAKDETVVCDGEKLSADGTLGKLAFTMNYEKADESENEEKTENYDSTESNGEEDNTEKDSTEENNAEE